MFTNEVKGFLAAIEWTEPFMLGLAAFHLSMLILAVRPLPPHSGVELRANLRSISHRSHTFEVAFLWGLTGETIH